MSADRCCESRWGRLGVVLSRELCLRRDFHVIDRRVWFRDRLVLTTWLPGLFDRFDHLFHDLGVQHFPGVERHGNAEFTLSVDPMAALGTQKLKSGLQKEALSF